MSQKSKNILGWVLTALLAFMFVSSAVMKFISSDDAAKGAAAMGLTPGTLQLIGVVEIVSLLLFIIPRTGVLGTLLLAAYMGGAIATHLEHQQPILITVVIQALLWITAIVRFPELSGRLFGKTVVDQKAESGAIQSSFARA